jgi:hypothetical protein
MKVASEEYDEDSLEDEDEDEELTGVSDDRCLVAADADFNHNIVLPQPGGKGEENIDGSALQPGMVV